jgi:enoyl-CoA hydratase
LIAPDAGEQLSPLAGPGALVLDLSETSSAQARRWRSTLLDQLPSLPCVTIAIEGGAGEESMRALEIACDVVLASSSELEELLAGFEKTPISALAFVQLLRSSPTPSTPSTRSTYAGLVAESFVYSTLQAGTEFHAWLAGRRQRPSKNLANEEPACRLWRDRGRLEINLSRPAKKNAFSRSMRDALVEALHLAISDPSIEEVVLRGDGDCFCSGGDLDEFGSLSNPAEAHAIRTTRSPAMLLARLAGRIRAEVHGACIGAGAELPAFANRVVATEGSFFQLPEVGLGLIPGAGGTVSLPRRIGRQKTAWLGLSGSRLDAQTALAWGLVDEVRLGQHV